MNDCPICSRPTDDPMVLGDLIENTGRWVREAVAHVAESHDNPVWSIDTADEETHKFMMLLQALSETHQFAQLGLVSAKSGQKVPAKALVRLAMDRAMTAWLALDDVYGWEKNGIAREQRDRADSDARMGLPEGSSTLAPDILQCWGLPPEAKRPSLPPFEPKNKYDQYWYNTYAVNSAFVHFRIRPISDWSEKMAPESTPFRRVVRDLHVCLCSLREDISNLEFVQYPSNLA